MPKGKKTGVSDSQNLDFPVIVKPDLPLIGKKDVKVVNDDLSFHSAVKQAAVASENGFAEVEEFIDGIDVSVLFYLEKGRARTIVYWDELIAINNGFGITGIGVSTPSVAVGTEVQSKIQRIVESFSSYFLDVQSLMILSFRIDWIGNPYIIELHADLGGDKIADILLPSSNPSFDFFERALQIACREYSEGIPGEFTPTALLYRKQNFAAMLHHKDINTEGEDIIVKANTIHDLHTLVGQCIGILGLKGIPQHLNWIENRMEKK